MTNGENTAEVPSCSLVKQCTNDYISETVYFAGQNICVIFFSAFSLPALTKCWFCLTCFMILQIPPPAPAVFNERMSENQGNKEESPMRLKDEIVRVGNIQPAAKDQAEDNEEEIIDSNKNIESEPENAPRNVPMGDADADEPNEKKPDAEIGQHEPDDPAEDLGRPIGDDVVHDLGDKEADEGEAMQGLNPVKQVGSLVDILRRLQKNL